MLRSSSQHCKDGSDCSCSFKRISFFFKSRQTVYIFRSMCPRHPCVHAKHPPNPPPPWPSHLLHARYVLSLIRPQLLIPPIPHLPASLPPFHPRPQSHLLVPNKLPQHPNPALVARQVGVKLPGHLMHGWQPAPRYGWEVMMLIMQTNIVRQQIQRAIV